MMSHIFHGNAALFPLPPLVHCQIAVAYYGHTIDTMVSVTHQRSRKRSRRRQRPPPAPWRQWPWRRSPITMTL